MEKNIYTPMYTRRHIYIYIKKINIMYNTSTYYACISYLLSKLCLYNVYTFLALLIFVYLLFT